jgi:hypothetical protein
MISRSLTLAGVLIIYIFILLLLNLEFSAAYSDEINSGVYSISSKPYGKSYGEWAAEWWKWFSSIPDDPIKHPSNDLTGRYCDANQNDPNMWFLTLTFGEGDIVDRSCTIPPGKSIFIPLLANDCSSAHNKIPSDEFLNCAKDQTDSISSSMYLKLDNKTEFEVLGNDRANSPLLNFTYPQGNVFGYEKGTYLGLVDGYFVILEPLPVGKHKLQIKTENINPFSGSIQSASSSLLVHDITYNLEIK